MIEEAQKMPDVITDCHFIDIRSIRRDGGTQMRAGISEDTHKDYTLLIRAAKEEADEESISTGREFFEVYKSPLPPVGLIYDGQSYWLWDGFHRLEGYKSASMPVIPAQVRSGTLKDAIILAAGANDNHGLRRTGKDKERAVTRLLEYSVEQLKENWTNREIARMAKVSHPFVADVRRKLSETRGSQFDPDQPRQVKRGEQVMTMDTLAIASSNEARSASSDFVAFDRDLQELLERGETTTTQCRIIMSQREARKRKELEEIEEELPPIEPPATTASQEDELDEDDLTDEEWLNELPIFKALSKKMHKGHLVKQDALDYRTLAQAGALTTFRHNTLRLQSVKSGETHFGIIIREASNVPHPKEWKVCEKCKGEACGKCGFAGYNVHQGIEPSRLSRED